MADITSIYGNPIKDAVARADIATNTQDISDLKDGLKNTIKSIGISEHFTIDAFGTPTSYTIYGDFKTGDIVRIGCVFTKAGTGAFNCAAQNSSGTNIKVFYSNETVDLTLVADTARLTFVLGKANTITALSAELTVTTKVFSELYDIEGELDEHGTDITTLFGVLTESVTVAPLLESGYWAFSDGSAGSSGNYGRSKTFLPKEATSISIASSYGYYICLLAYEGDTYIGTWNHNTKTFDVISSLTSPYGDFSYDLATIKEAHPTYRYKIDIREVSVTGALDPTTIGGYIYLTVPSIGQHIVTVEKDGTGDFDKLTDAINYATLFMDSIVYVGDGTWDLIAEFGGGLNNISSSNWGLYLGNRVHVIFSSNSKVTANYTGSNTNVLRYFSPFNTGKYGFTLENATIEASRCRYCVHDERGEETDHYESHYINCSMLMDNSNNEAWTTAQCIGGGLGRSGYIDIDGCVFDSNMWGGIVSYHNCAYANSKSNINLHNSYFKRHGTFRLCWYGVSTEITTAYVSGCSFASAIVHRAETESATVENTAVVEWNNVIRT